MWVSTRSHASKGGSLNIHMNLITVSLMCHADSKGSVTRKPHVAATTQRNRPITNNVLLNRLCQSQRAIVQPAPGSFVGLADGPGDEVGAGCVRTVPRSSLTHALRKTPF